MPACFLMTIPVLLPQILCIYTYFGWYPEVTKGKKVSSFVIFLESMYGAEQNVLLLLSLIYLIFFLVGLQCVF